MLLVRVRSALAVERNPYVLFYEDDRVRFSVCDCYVCRPSSERLSDACIAGVQAMSGKATNMGMFCSYFYLCVVMFYRFFDWQSIVKMSKRVVI